MLALLPSVHGNYCRTEALSKGLFFILQRLPYDIACLYPVLKSQTRNSNLPEAPSSLNGSKEDFNKYL